MALDAGFWEGERKALFRVLFPQILKYATDGAQNALVQLLGDVEVGVDWGLVNDSVYDWARNYVYGLVSNLSETSLQFTQKAVSQWIESGAPLDDLIKDITPMFGEVRAKMIATTEVTRAYAEGNIKSWLESGVVDGQRWMTGEDDRVCPLCSPLAGREDTLNGDFGGQGRPPLHVNCRCYLQPIVMLPK